jgi:hypothetical protein
VGPGFSAIICASVCGWRVELDYSAADKLISLVKDDGLSWCHGSLWLSETDLRPFVSGQ